MKKLIIILILLGFTVSFAFAADYIIKSNGTISGVSSYRVECTAGCSYIIYKKNGTWYRGDIGHMGDKYNSWSIDEVASYLCK